MKRILTVIGAVLIALGMQAATELTIDRLQTQQIATDCVAYILFHDDSGKGFVFPVYVDPKDGDVEWGRVYTIDEMNRVYTYWMLSDYWTHSVYTDATFMKEVSDDAHIYIEATASDQNGDDWILIYDEQAKEGIEAVSAPQKAKKVLENGQLLIIQGDRKFTILGNPSY